jgi:hypothetical protein
MNATDILLEWVLPLLLYTGAAVPMTVALILDRHSDERHRRHRRLFVILITVQAVSFLPFIIALVLRLPHAIHGLLWPALVGVVLFLWGSVILVSECIHRFRPESNQNAAPNGGPAASVDNSNAPSGPVS